MINIKSNLVRKVRSIKSRTKISELDDIKDCIKKIQTQQIEINHNQMSLLKDIEIHSKNIKTINVSETELVTKLFNGLKIYLDPRDLAVSVHIALDGVWEDSVTKAWLSVQKDNSVIFDIGANFGYFGLLAAQATDHSSRVHFFDANPNLMPYLRKSLSINWFNEKSTLVNKAISNKSGKSTINILEDFIGSSSVQSVEQLNSYLKDTIDVKVKESVEIEAINIDQYCSSLNISNVDLVKIDIEGYEEKAYEGMSSVIEKSNNLIVFLEFTRQAYENPKKFYDRIRRDFQYLYTIDSKTGGLISQSAKEYTESIGLEKSWIMLVASKKPLISTDIKE